MNLVIGAFPYFALPFVISLVLVPVCKLIGLKLGFYAVENARTVHHGRIVRIGGVAIFLAFLISLAVLWAADDTLNGILIGGFLVFMGGLLDDIYDLSRRSNWHCRSAGQCVPCCSAICTWTACISSR